MKIEKPLFRKDKADSELVSLIILLPIVLALLFTMIDVTIYFANVNQIQSAVKDGARTVAIMGGNGNATQGSSIEVTYGLTKAEACTDAAVNSERTKNAFSAETTPIECSVLDKYANNPGIINVTIESLKCGPILTDVAIGQTTSCVAEWKYDGIPGSSLGFIKNENGYPMREGTTVGQSESEVKMDSGNLYNR